MIAKHNFVLRSLKEWGLAVPRAFENENSPFVISGLN